MILSPLQTSRHRFDIIPFFVSLLQKQFDKNFNITSTVSDSTRQVVIHIINNNWDSFCEVGASRSIINFEFSLILGTTNLCVATN